MSFHSGLPVRNLVQRIALVGVLSLAVPIASWAHSHSSQNNTPGGSTCFPGMVCIYNQGGTAVGGLTGLTMDGTAGSTVSNVVGVGSQSVTGTLALTTGAFSGSSFGTGTCSPYPCTLGTFGSGSLTITVNNWNNFSGTLFTGTFGGPNGITWQYNGKVNNVYQYALVGPISGTWYTGGTVGGQTTQFYFTSKTAYKGGSINLSSGTTSVSTPEPANIGLVGSGLVLIGFLIRRKARVELGR